MKFLQLSCFQLQFSSSELSEVSNGFSAKSLVFPLGPYTDAAISITLSQNNIQKTKEQVSFLRSSIFFIRVENLFQEGSVSPTPTNIQHHHRQPSLSPLVRIGSQSQALCLSGPLDHCCQEWALPGKMQGGKMAVGCLSYSPSYLLFLCFCWS